MDIEIQPGGVWYHGSNVRFTHLRPNSTVTQWRALAEAFSHRPAMLCIEDDGSIRHNGTEKGWLYKIDEPVDLEKDVRPHPRTAMDQNAEFLTTRPLRVTPLCETGAPSGKETHHEHSI